MKVTEFDTPPPPQKKEKKKRPELKVLEFSPKGLEVESEKWESTIPISDDPSIRMGIVDAIVISPLDVKNVLDSPLVGCSSQRGKRV